jgi:hypothetical protein
MFFEKYMGRVVLVVNEEYDKEPFEQWLKKEGYKPSMYEFIDEIAPDLKAQKIHRIGSVFGRINWYVDNNARVCSETLALGIPTMVVAAPYIVRPEWDTQRELRQWDTLVTEMDNQALKAAEKSWGDV